MLERKLDRLTVTSYSDSDSVDIKVEYNPAVYADIKIRNTREVKDLIYLLSELIKPKKER